MGHLLFNSVPPAIELPGFINVDRARRSQHARALRFPMASPQVAAMAAAIQTPSGGTDRFDERRKRRIADQILFVPLAARRQRDHAIEQRAPSLEEPKVC